MTEKKFEFPMRTLKAFVGQDGLKHVVAVASDNKIDLYREFFDVSALADMVQSCKSVKPNKPEEGRVDLMETHFETFGFGYATNAWIKHITETEEDGETYELYMDFALKNDWPQANEIYEEVKNKQIVKQLSVGGYIDDYDENTEELEVSFADEDGNEVILPVLKIKKFNLEHVATTPEGWAVNPRTRFEDVKSKDVGFMGYIYKSLSDEKAQKEIQERLGKMKEQPEETKTEEKDKNVTIADIPRMMKSILVEFFTERNEMPNIEKAKELLEELKGLELSDEEREQLNLSFEEETEETEEETEETEEDTPEVPDVSEEIEKSLSPVRETLKSLQEKLDSDKTGETVESLKSDLAGLKETLETSLKERDGVIEELKSQIEELGGETIPPADEPVETKSKSKEPKEEEPERTVDTMWEN